jgi:SH3-like domain-containing protein
VNAWRHATGLALLCLAWPAAALDYRSIAEAAVLYDAPSAKAQKLFVVSRYTPVEVVVSVEGWLKIRDAEGSLSWVERRQVSDRHTVLVRAERAQVRTLADDKAPLAFEAEKDVVLDLLDAGSGGWAKVQHRDGSTGFVSVKQVWGL